MTCRSCWVRLQSPRAEAGPGCSAHSTTSAAGVEGPEGLAVGPGCLVCPWAAARPRVVRAASFARRVASKPGQALPPPTGTAAWPSTPVGPCRLMVSGASSRSLAWPRRRPRAQQPGQRGYRAPSNFACNSPVTISGFELASLELQRFRRLLKVHATELHAKFLVGVCAFTHGPSCRAQLPGPAAGARRLRASW